ncbi:hypothetical protein DEJ16_01935 [Curtobacterium sp. MCJR17_055]|uniref:hypothetical protein n=1 Tax=unclassified Curtobacterium TaxID=257496 RepID=UPI000D853C01|nr:MULTISPECIES: hypothetical protein [unclassified Curtobacterium]PYY36867.1 hypothetical protein DEI87_04210 [Curtobacterium sp. MCBD17_029]PYY58022.1 hypothetical protein DEJ26_10625 [Curtobacterium sp. MCPF17_015]PYY58472.1 hypothetical protein DEJ16_01935 [Curtobacterium sp. MCJR17_055]WIB36662.1 hypothetical protein DEJ15_06135 [Curtobacterium sp. MCJR17_043]
MNVVAAVVLATNPFATAALVVVSVMGIALVGTARFLGRRAAEQAREGEPTPPPDDLEPGSS